jgi:hypothetical protein
MGNPARPRLSLGSLAASAGAVAIALVVFAGEYGFHRDELYFLAAGERLDWGYPDQGPLTPAIAALVNAIAPDSLTALRVPSALATAGTVLLTGVLAWELGAESRAQLIAAGCVAVGAVFLITGHLLSTTTFDLLAWTVLLWLAVRGVRTGDDRLWLPAGFVLGLALLNKPLPAFLAAGLLAGVAIAGPRRLLRSPWVWAGAAIALALWAPWLIWQADTGWPQLDVAENITAGGSASSEPRWAFLPFQLLLVSPLLIPVWIAGLVALLRDPRLRPYRFLAWTWIFLAAAFLATGGKPYYLAGMFPVLLAAGAPAVDRWLDRGREGLRRVALGTAFATSAAVSAVIALPLLPASDLEPVLALNEDAGETVGWPELTAIVADVHARAPGPGPVTIYTANYGEAGAIDRYGPDLGLPRAHSGHNAYAEWGTPNGSGTVIVIGYLDEGILRSSFRGCRLGARVSNEAGIENDEDGAPIWLCRAPDRPWPELADELAHLG